MRRYGRLRRARFVGRVMPAALTVLPMFGLLLATLVDPSLGAVTVAVIAVVAAVLGTIGVAAIRPALAASGRFARLEQQHRVLERLAMQDPLTGINNRRGGEWLLGRTGRLLTARPGPLSVAVVDVDNLRELNAAGGHARGDAGLRRLATALESVLGEHDWVARWGGDEFLVVCHCAAPGMIVLMERARGSLAIEAVRADVVRVSVGVAELQPTESLSDCIVRADLALYAAKGQGRDKIRAA